MLRAAAEVELSALPRYAIDEAVGLHCQHHLVYRWWRNAKVPLHVRLRWCPAVHLRVVVDEGQILALFVRCFFTPETKIVIKSLPARAHTAV